MQNFTRRTLLKMAGGATLSLGVPLKVLGVLADGTMLVQDHRVPAEKNLSGRVEAHYLEEKRKYGPARRLIRSECRSEASLPDSSICAVTVRWAARELFNHHEFQDKGPYSYAKRAIPHIVKFGFSITVGDKTWLLNKSGFKQISFKGEHPIGTIRYEDDGCPVQAEMVAYSPFIPLNAKDSGLPATIFEITFKNRGDKAVKD